MLYAPFVAAVQIVLYAGGIMVLFLFVIMLVNLEKNIREYQWNKQWLVGTIAALTLGGLLLFLVRRGNDIFPKDLRRIAGRDRTHSRLASGYMAITCCRLRLHRSCYW